MASVVEVRIKDGLDDILRFYRLLGFFPVAECSTTQRENHHHHKRWGSCNAASFRRALTIGIRCFHALMVLVLEFHFIKFIHSIPEMSPSVFPLLIWDEVVYGATFFININSLFVRLPKFTKAAIKIRGLVLSQGTSGSKVFERMKLIALACIAYSIAAAGARVMAMLTLHVKDGKSIVVSQSWVVCGLAWYETVDLRVIVIVLWLGFYHWFSLREIRDRVNLSLKGRWDETRIDAQLVELQQLVASFHSTQKFTSTSLLLSVPILVYVTIFYSCIFLIGQQQMGNLCFAIPRAIERILTLTGLTMLSSAIDSEVSLSNIIIRSNRFMIFPIFISIEGSNNLQINKILH